ncbi:hypothetical protein EYM_05005 [Ignicoccus islandicus DSM 13165]|uniref:Uncharacterized protein n=1 Tax=Ignicoccus islandicus DSM 13165 TaxID=940295 RepID=A0A0U2MB31_9CREN|nr:hypothetical protein [Ignicoccus islandicus]ALU12541.1 hypothetical protein EYM_05005 [Ignicoccus islandicus DSM 13165]
MAKTGFIILRGHELKDFVRLYKVAKVVSLETDDPIVVVVDEHTLDSIPDDQLFLVFIPLPLMFKIAKSAPQPTIEEVREEVKEEGASSEGQLAEEIIEESITERKLKQLVEFVKWELGDESKKLPFRILDVTYERDPDLNLWTLKVRMGKVEKLSVSVVGVSKILYMNLIEKMQEIGFIEPLVAVVSLEGQTLYVVVDTVIDNLIKTVLTSSGLVMKDNLITINVAENMINALIVAERSPDSKVGLFSGYKIAEEIAKIIKDRLNWKGAVKVRLRIGMFDYVKTA